MKPDAVVCGTYRGFRKVRPGREDELSPKERKEVAKDKTGSNLELRIDGTFLRQVTEGTWSRSGDRIQFYPVTFGGETLEGMRRRTEEGGRMFGLAFIFDPFELVVTEEGLETPDDGGPLMTEYRRENSP